MFSIFFKGLNPLGSDTFIPDVRSVSVFKAFNETYMTVANYKLESRDGYNLFKIKFRRNATKSSFQTIPDIVKQMLTDMKQELANVSFLIECTE